MARRTKPHQTDGASEGIEVRSMFRPPSAGEIYFCQLFAGSQKSIGVILNSVNGPFHNGQPALFSWGHCIQIVITRLRNFHVQAVIISQQGLVACFHFKAFNLLIVPKLSAFCHPIPILPGYQLHIGCKDNLLGMIILPGCGGFPLGTDGRARQIACHIARA